MNPDYDVLIVGAGLSGISMAYNLQQKCPSLNYSILEAREAIGGTWDLFRYPGVRSDSDMYTLGYNFKPWKGEKAIADGPSILKYIQETAKENAIDSKIQFGHKILSANWSNEDKKWTVEISKTNSEEIITKTCKFLIMCSGYYDFDNGYTPKFIDLEKFEGKFIHPQKWDESLDYSDKKIVIIGSGATAVTLLPVLAKKAKHVTMLQRSPTYYTILPSVDPIAEKIKKFLPSKLAHHMIRWMNVCINTGFYLYCRKFPNSAKKFLAKPFKYYFKKIKDPELYVEKNFKPKYQPWDERLCLVPDGDLFKAIQNESANVVTDQIERFTKAGIKLKSGGELEADIIVSATGLNLKFLAGMQLSIDDKPIKVNELLPYKGSMFSGVPNMGMIFGYTNNSWTLKCNLISDWLAEILKHMHKKNYSIVVPEANPDIKTKPLLNFTSGYIRRSEKELPKQGEKNPWKVNQNYFADIYTFKFRPLKDKDLNFK